MVTVTAVRLFREADQLMVALFGSPSSVADGWLENRPATEVFAAPADGLPLEQTLPIDAVRALVPLAAPWMPMPSTPAADASLQAALQRLAHRLPQALPADQLAALADRCLAADRPDLALPLLDALTDDPARRLAAARCRLSLGQAVGARGALELLAGDPAVAADPMLAAEVLDTYAWDLLRDGVTEPLPGLIEQLRPLPDSLPRVDRLARVLSTIDWIASVAPDAIGHSRDLRGGGGPALALDAVQMSPCGAVTLVNGWLLDPADSIDSLVLLRGRRARRLLLADALRTPRPDLGDLLAEAGLPADTPAGFVLRAMDGVEEAAPPQEGEQACVFVVTRTGEQCCLRQPVELIGFDNGAIQAFAVG
jgi:hypothetical protein